MKERGILFGADMVKAIIDGRKGQTRRIMKVQPECPEFELRYIAESTARSEVGKYCWAEPGVTLNPRRSKLFSSPYGQPGDRLWVRETCRASELSSQHHDAVIYLADTATQVIKDTKEAADDWLKLFSYRGGKGKVVPAIHMPRWASRLTLEITNVGVQRLQSISQNDAAREGLVRLPASGRYCINQGDQYFGGASHDAREVFSWLWESVYGDEAWQANPWVWVYEFRRIEEGEPV